MLDYEIKVEGIEKDGHPLTEIFSFGLSASDRYDQLVKQYPYNKVVLSKTEKRIITFSKPQMRLAPECPRGHEGLYRNKFPIVRQGGDGKYFCTICTWRES